MAIRQGLPFGVPSAIRSTAVVGYSCQTRLALALQAAFDDPDELFVWFTTELNPPSVDLTSRPLHIYEDLDVAVRLGSDQHPKVKELRERYVAAVLIRVSDVRRQYELIELVRSAPLDWFGPVLLKLDLEGVGLGAHRTAALEHDASSGDRDEYLALDFPGDRCAVIVE